MMLIFLVYLLGLLYGALCTEESCLYNAEIECGVHNIIPNPFPGNEEELQNACSDLNRIKQCIADAARNCSSADGAEDAERTGRIRRQLKDQQRLIDVTTEICEEGSELHSNFVPDMACYREVIDTHNREQQCRDYSSNVEDYIRSRINAKLEGREEDQRRKFRECLRVLLDMNCFLELFIQKCSYRAKDTVIEIIEKGGSLDDQCPVSIHIDILELLDPLKLVTKKEMHVRQLLETDSFF